MLTNKIPYHYHVIRPHPPPSLSQLENPTKEKEEEKKERKKKKANEYVEFSHVNCVRVLI